MKKAKIELTVKQRQNLRLGREKAKINRETKTKAKMGVMLEEYFKQKCEESETEQVDACTTTPFSLRDYDFGQNSGE